MQNIIFGSVIIASALLAFGIATTTLTAVSDRQAGWHVEQANPISEAVYWVGNHASRI